MRIVVDGLVAVACIFAVGTAGTTNNFNDASLGQGPVGWTATQTGDGKARWTIEKDESAPGKSKVLKQSGVATFPICIKEDSKLKNGYVEVRFKAVSGNEDQAGGVIWRCKDQNNYYVARANALEDNVTIYHTIAGRRESFKSVNAKVVSGVWHSLRVEFKGNQFIVTFDGKKVMDATDESFPDAGKVGLWTKADSVILFDDFNFAEK